MAIRNIILLGGSTVALVLLSQYKIIFLRLYSWPIYVLFGFFLWLIFHLIVLPGNFEEQLHEATGDWLRTFLATIMGLALGLVLSDPARQLPARFRSVHEPVLIAGVAGTVIIFCIRYLYEVLDTGQWIHKDFFMFPYLGKTPLVIFGGLLLPAMFIKFLFARDGLSPKAWFFIASTGVISTIFAFYFANTKNGIAIFFLTFIYFFIQIIITGKTARLRRTGIITSIIGFTLLAGLVLKNHLQNNSAWPNLIADYKIGSEIESHTNWKDATAPLPLNQYGTPVNESTYLRVAWGHAGLELLKEHPLGYGQIHHSFGALALQKWNDFHKPDGKNRGATHSGWLDFALGFGLPGLLLVCIPLGVSYIRARKMVGFWNTYATWTIPVMAISYLITEVCTDHFIELLFFMTAFFSGLTITKKNEPSDEIVGSI